MHGSSLCFFLLRTSKTKDNKSCLIDTAQRQGGRLHGPPSHGVPIDRHQEQDLCHLFAHHTDVGVVASLGPNSVVMNIFSPSSSYLVCDISIKLLHDAFPKETQLYRKKYNRKRLECRKLQKDTSNSSYWQNSSCLARSWKEAGLPWSCNSPVETAVNMSKPSRSAWRIMRDN